MRQFFGISGGAAAAVLVLFGCSETGIEDIPVYYVVECGEAECSKVYSIDSSQLALLHACYGTETGWEPFYEDLTGCPLPGSLGENGCEIELGPTETAVYSCGATCISPLQENWEEFVDECCSVESDPLDIPYSELGDALESAATACGVTLDVPLASCGYKYGHSPALGEECESDDKVNAYGADYLFDIDPSYSYIELHGFNDTELVSVTGSGAIGSGPARFLSAVMWADAGTLGTHAFSDWMFVLGSPVLFNVSSGAITLPAANEPEFFGRGLDGTALEAFQFHASEDAVGYMNLNNGTWYLDYIETSGSSSVELHLEGVVSTP